MIRAARQDNEAGAAQALSAGPSRGSKFRRLLLDAARRLAPPLELGAVCERVVLLLVPAVADACRVYFRSAEAARWRAFVSSSAPAVDQAAFAGLEIDQVIAEAGVSRRTIVKPATGELDPWSYALVPLNAHAAVLGVPVLAAGRARGPYGPDDGELREVLETLGARLTLALDNARLSLQVEEAHARDLRTAGLNARPGEARLGPTEVLQPTSTPEPAAGSGRSGYADRLAVRAGHRVCVVRVDEIDWIEARNYCAKLHVGSRAYVMRDTMTRLAARLDPALFLRIHRSTIINVDRLQSLEPCLHGRYQIQLRDGTRLTVSRNRRADLARVLGYWSGG